jgi:predicted RNA-binding Zn-ribbon protein involved in translation (DUF1610 family)
MLKFICPSCNGTVLREEQIVKKINKITRISIAGRPIEYEEQREVGSKTYSCDKCGLDLGDNPLELIKALEINRFTETIG